MKASLVIPFKNEEEYAALTLAQAYDDLSARGVDFELVAVDDSSDGTWDILQAFRPGDERVVVIKGGDPPGYGKALRQGFAAASGDILIPFNGDLCDSLDDVHAYIELIESGYDMVFGSRYMPGARVVGHPTAKVWLSRVGNAVFQFLFRAECSDLTNTFKAYRRQVIEDIQPQSRGYDLGIEMALKGIVRGYRYTTIPVTWTDREYGVSKMSVLKSLLTHLRTGLSIRFTYR